MEKAIGLAELVAQLDPGAGVVGVEVDPLDPERRVEVRRSLNRTGP
jgi:hypothetical protein